MYSRNYSNFVRPTSPLEINNPNVPSISGEEAKRIYLKEVPEVKDPIPCTEIYTNSNKQCQDTREQVQESLDYNITNKDLFLIVQNNDIHKLRQVLDNSPDKINILDDYGWSLLMIACQANSVDTVKELLKRGINTSIRDKAGNTARSLVLKNKNLKLADVFLSYKNIEIESKSKESNVMREEYLCDICNSQYLDKQHHLLSTIHNINASKGKKIPANYVIPTSNRGYQIMLKVGWDKESGLGPNGSGKRYPIKTVQKKDRKGLGQEKRKTEEKIKDAPTRHTNRQLLTINKHYNRRMEINFRREFY